ncbi:MAG: tRNA pseudouridine(13) synthase TruD, partial [Candidatus Taylorbacteria bacterium]|nr:tRNA pseudouridine(13) synthase TruD [Candidatus Taylorbacteria bacterium]
MNTPEYKLKARNEDFEVTEVPLLPRFLEKGSFTYVWLKKSGFYTFDALEAIGEHFELFYEDMAAEGLKDEDGITSQIISIKKSLKQTDMSAFNKKHSNKASSYILMERIMGYGDAPVAEKMLHGNSFNLVVRNLKDDVAARIEEFCKKNKFVTFVNYYDSQRFGLPGGPYNTHLIGKAIVEEDWKEAYEQLL